MATLKNQMDSLLSPEDMMLEGLEEGTIEQAVEDLKSFGKGAAFSPVTGAADVVETGKMLPELDEKVKPFFPTYSSIEGAFEELYNLGFNRENAVKAIKNLTGVELKSDTAEMAGEIVGLPTVAASKAVGAIAKTAGKYGSKAPEAVERISTEARKLFSAAGGFDDLAVATAGSPSAQTAKMLSAPELPDTSITKIIIGPSGRDYQKKEASYRSARKELSTTGSATDPVTDKEAQELWNRTGAQEDLVDNDIVYEIPTVNAKLKLTNPKSRYADSPFAYDAGTVTYNPKVKTTLSDILDFDELFEQAPYLKDVEVRRISPLAKLLGTSAAYNPTDNIIYIASGPTKKLTSDLLHEVEHAVQAADGKTFAGGNFRLIMDQDPEYKKLGGAEGKKKLDKAKESLVDKYGGKYDVTEDASGEAREAVRGMLTLLDASPNPSKFIRAVVKLPKVEGAKRGGGAFKYLSHIQDYMDDNFPEINAEYMSPIDEAMKFIRTADKKTIDAILKDYKDLNLSDLQKFERIKEKAILKYMRDPGEVTARNVQFRYMLSQADPSITRVAPRFTEDKAANPSQIPKMEISDPNKISQPPKDSRSYSDVETLRSKAQELDVPLSDDGPLAITERQGYYLSSSAERGDDARDVLRQSIVDFGDAKRDKELKGTLNQMRGRMNQIMKESSEAYKLFVDRGDTEKLIPGTKILSMGNDKGLAKKPLIVEGYSVWRQNPERETNLYKKYDAYLIDRGLIPSEPQFIEHKGKSYRLMIHLRDADGNVNAHYADMVTYKPEIFTKPKVVESLGPANVRKTRAEYERTKLEQEKRQDLLSNPNKLAAYAAEKEIPVADMQKLLTDNFNRNKTTLEELEKIVNTDDFIAAENEVRKRGASLGFKNIKEQTSEAFAKPLEIGVSEFAQSGKLLKNYDSSTLQEITAKSKAASAGNARADKLIGADVAEGTKVGVRLNLNSKIEDMPAGLNKLQTVHKGNYNGQALSYRPYVTVRNAVFNVNQKGRAAVAAKIKGSQSEAAKNKYNLASVDGNITSVENVFDSVDGDVVEIGFNPASTHLFIDLSTGQAVKNAEIATVVGDRVYAKGVTYLKKAEAPEAKNPEMFTFEDGTEIPSEVRYKMKKGGVVPMKNMAQQMELFADGGLMDEGGMIDEQSGNEVPPGSLREEVRDDIPANLSEGEFVFPADVVRYWGLETLMRMRQEAKMGLKRMEQMGQMGNADEAVIPDDLPFTIDDLDMEDEQEYNFAVGGTTPTTPTTTPPPMTPSLPPSPYNSTPAATKPLAAVGQAATPVTAASATPATIGAFNPQLQGTQFTPITTAQGVMPTFQQTVGAGVPNVDFEYVEYVNEAGQIIKLRKSKTTGEMLDPIPEGYKLKTDVVESATTTPTGVETARVQDDNGNDDSTMTTGATISFGGTPATGRRSGLVDNAFRGNISFGTETKPAFGLAGIMNTASQFKQGMVRSASSLMDIFTGGKMGQPLSLNPGETATITNIEVPRSMTPGRGVSRPDVLTVGMRLDAKTFNDLYTRLGSNKVSSRQELARIAEHLKEFYEDPRNKGMIVDVDQRMRDQIKQIDEARAGLETGNDFITITDRDSDGNQFKTEVSRDVAEKVSQGVDLEAAAWESGFTSNESTQTGGVSASQAAARAAALDAEDRDDGNTGPGSDNNNDWSGGTDSNQPICLTEDMKVKLNGVIDFVTNVKVGDIVDNTVVTEVLHKHMREGYYVVNGELKITNDHPVLANGSWKRTEDLVLGDYINNVEVTSLEYIEQVTPTVYIGTADDRYDVYTEGEVYTVHGQYKNGLKQAA